MAQRLVYALGITLLLWMVTANARVLSQGEPSRGFFWQEIKESGRDARYVCLSQQAPGVPRDPSECKKAGAQKPVY